MSSPPLRLCWWEVDELLEHFRSRPALWTQSEINENLWLREDTRAEQAEDAFALLFIPPKDSTNKFRTYSLQPLPISWAETDILAYLNWCFGHWTSYQQRVIVTKFLVEELAIPEETAFLAAIAIEGLSWEAAEAPEPPAPPIQEELWPENGIPPSTYDFRKDPTLLGTFLLDGNAGWVQLRLLGGMIRASLSLRSKRGAKSIPLHGFVRPLNGRTRDAAAEIAGWPAEVTDEAASLTEEQLDYLVDRPESTLPTIRTEEHE